MIEKFKHVLNTIEKYMLEILFLVMTVVVLAAIFNRVTVNAQMAWSDELSRYLFVWIVFIASARVVGDKGHVGVTALVDIFPQKLRRVVELLVYVLCLMLSVVLIYYTAIIIKTQTMYGQVSPSLRIPMQYPYFGMVVGGVFMMLHLLFHIIDFFTAKPAEDAEPAERMDTV